MKKWVLKFEIILLWFMFIEHLQKYWEGGLSALSKLNNCSIFITSFSLPSCFPGAEVAQNKNKQRSCKAFLVQFSHSVMSDSFRPHEPQHCQVSLSINNSQSPPKPMSTESVMPSDHLIFYRPLLLLPSIFPSIRVFSNESALCKSF